MLHRFKHIPAVAVRLKSAEMALQLRNIPWVDYVTTGSGLVTPDLMTQHCEPISSPQVIPWNIERVNAQDAWQYATGGNAPKRLVILDDGADEDGNSWYSIELYWEVLSYYVPSTLHDGWHGTPVLGAAIARDNEYGTVGVAPDAIARVMKIFDPTTGNHEDTWWEVNSAIAVDDNATLATVMTISYSTKITSPNPPATFTGFYDAITNAYYQHDVLFTASTGNQWRSDFYAFPANFDEVIGVGGSGHNDEYVLNNYAPGNVELAAPAVDILTVCKGGDIGEYNGTSLATPQVAATIMLMRELDPSLSNEEIRQRLQNTAVPMVDPQKSGAGRLDVLAAVTYGMTPFAPHITLDATGMNPKLNWNTVSVADSYKIYRGTMQGQPGTVACHLIWDYYHIANTTSTTYTDHSVWIDPNENILACYYATSVNQNGESVPSNKVGVHGMAPLKEDELITAETISLPEEFAIFDNYPNPFNPVTTIRYNIPEPSTVSLIIYDITGREVRRLVDGTVEPGYHSAVWDGAGISGTTVSSGVYIYRFTAVPANESSHEGITTVRKMVFTK